jgi:hypothetical protein
LTWKAANVQDVQRIVRQAGKPEFVDIEDTATSDKLGKIVTISGISNSAKLSFALGTGDLNISLPSSYTANSISTNNGAIIAGDPGALSEYNFSISIVVPANNGTISLSRQIIVEDGAGHRDTCTLTLAAADAYLTVAIGDIELGWEGNPVAVTVESNTTWTVE